MQKQFEKKLIKKQFIPRGRLFSTTPASVPISVKTSGPQALTGPKASGRDKRLVNTSICCSVHGRDICRRNRTATLQFKEKDSGLYAPPRVCKYFLLRFPELRDVPASCYSTSVRRWMFIRLISLKPQPSVSVRVFEDKSVLYCF